MQFTPDFLDEIRTRLACSSVVGKRVRLVKKGREFQALCPFHNEKTPSFYVNDDKGFFHCFGCGAHGDVIGFTMRFDNLGFPEAVERLAGEAGLEMPRATPEESARAERRKTLADTVEAAAQWFEKILWSPAGQPGLDYLRRRGLSDATIRSFRLGYAPDGRDLLKQAMRQRGIDEALLLEAGLLVKPEDNRESFDFFRGRVMFPIADARGRLVAFGGRILGDGQPKYLNSRDTPLFDKGRTLYALDKARQALRERAEIIVAEGYMDVIALHAGGFKGAVAPLGTALGENQLELLWRLAPEPTICLDGDAAGQRAAKRAAERALPRLQPGRSLRFATLPAGEDPDSLLRSGGRAAFEEALAGAQPLVEAVWNATLAERPIDTPERRAALEKELDHTAATIADPQVQAQYRQEFRARLFGLFRPATRSRSAKSIHRGLTPGYADRAAMRARLPAPSPARSVQFLLATAIAFPQLLESDAEAFAQLPIDDPALDRVRRCVLEALDQDPDLGRDGLRLHLNRAGFEGIVARLFEASVYKDLAFTRGDVLEDARLHWAKALLELHKRGTRDELRRAGEIDGDALDEDWEKRRTEMLREMARTQAQEIDEEPPIIAPAAKRPA
jgi:DNA primase